MSLVPKPFHELLKMEFEIPPYQRGYRWDNEQVDMLLDDLYDFIKSHGRKPTKDYHFESPYYCLQPICIVPIAGTSTISTILGMVVGSRSPQR